MLEFKIVKHPDQVLNLIQEFDQNNQTWIVSDLKSKKEIQQKCLNDQGYYVDESILRMSDFWKLWLRRLAPDIRVVSSDFIKILVKRYVLQFSDLHQLKSQESSTLYKYMSDLAPLLLHPESYQYLKDWFAEKTEDVHWQKWMILSQSCLNYILSEHKCIETSWVVSFLLQCDLNKLSWNRKLIFDLGSQMSSLEMGILKVISKMTDVVVIVPNPEWKAKFNFTLRTYTDYIGYVDYKKFLPDVESKAYRPEQFKRFNSEVSEIKFITRQAREWISQGVPPNEIILLSPRIEDYWPMLKLHFDYEGISYQKDVVSRAISLGLIQSWVSEIEIVCQNATWEHLETTFGRTIDSEQILQFEKFKSYYYQLIDNDDIQREEKYAQFFKVDFSTDEDMSRQQFLAITLKVWFTIDRQMQSLSLFENLIKDFMAQTIEISLPFKDWFQSLKERLSKKEIKIQEASSEGIQILPVQSAQILSGQKAIWFGLDESGLMSKQKSLIPIQDIEELKKTFDLAIDYPEESHAEFNLRWFSMSAVKDHIFTMSDVNYSGDVLSPSVFFLENNSSHFDFIRPETRLDRLMKNFDQISTKSDQLNIDSDLNGRTIQFELQQNSSVGVTELESLTQCSFIFLVQKGFKIRDTASLGIDLDPRQRGSLVHDLFKYIIDDKKYLNLNMNEVEAFLNQARKRLDLFKNTEHFWKVYLNKLLKTADQFARFEKQRLSLAPQINHHTEVPFSLFYDVTEKTLTASKPIGPFIEIKGRIDRYDSNANGSEAIIYDYKSSNSQQTNYPDKWIDNHEYQFLFYQMALQNVFSKKTSGAFYYFYKTLEIFKGFYRIEIEGELKSTIDLRKKASFDEDKFKKLLGQFEEKYLSLFDFLKEGKFTAKPNDYKICVTCDWKKICRAPHLN